MTKGLLECTREGYINSQYLSEGEFKEFLEIARSVTIPHTPSKVEAILAKAELAGFEVLDYREGPKPAARSPRNADWC